MRQSLLINELSGQAQIQLMIAVKMSKRFTTIDELRAAGNWRRHVFNTIDRSELLKKRRLRAQGICSASGGGTTQLCIRSS